MVLSHFNNFLTIFMIPREKERRRAKSLVKRYTGPNTGGARQNRFRYHFIG